VILFENLAHVTFKYFTETPAEEMDQVTAPIGDVEYIFMTLTGNIFCWDIRLTQ
jgi:hypothetical protein